MAKADPDRDTYNKAVRDHIIRVIESGVSRRVMANVLVVTRAAVSSYVIGRTTSEKYWHVYNYLARQWYETEYGKVPYGDRYYGVAMDYLSMRAATEMTRMIWGESDQSTAA
jgi:hypothetical protein